MLEVYRAFAEDCMAMPVLAGQKTETREVRRRASHLLHRSDDAGQEGAAGRHLHNLGQNFAKAFDTAVPGPRRQAAPRLADVLGRLHPAHRRR